MYKTEVRGLLVEGGKTLGNVTTDVIRPLELKAAPWWKISLVITIAMTIWGLYSIYETVTVGIGRGVLSGQQFGGRQPAADGCFAPFAGVAKLALIDLPDLVNGLHGRHNQNCDA